MTGRTPASRQLRKRLDAQLVAPLEWTEAESEYITLAGHAADRASVVQGLLDAELAAEEPRAVLVVKLSAELRLLERQQATLISMLNPDGEGTAKSERHRRAARARWDRQGHVG